MTSQINPNDIDGNYPIAGVSNNTQGMRDNFTNTRTNFQYASDEITDLQSKALLKAALTGTTLDNNLANNVMYNAQIRGFSGTTVAIANTSGTINIDCNAGHYQSIYMAGNISLGFDSNTWPTAGTAGMIRTQITVDQAGRTMALPVAVSNGVTGIQGFSSNVITFAQSGTYEFGFLTTTGGSNITIFDLNRPLNYYTNDVTVVGNVVSGQNFIGNGSLLTGITANAGPVITNGTSNIAVLANANIRINVAGSSNVAVFASTGEYVTGVVSATGNVTGGNILTAGVVSSLGNILTAGLVSSTGNITGGNILTAGVVSSTGNITGNYFIGNGSQLTGVTQLTQIVSGTTQLAVEVPSGNIQATINGIANVVVFTSIGANITGYVNATGNITGANATINGLVTATGNVTGGNIRTGGTISATGNLTSANINATGNVSLTGNVIAGNLTTSNQVVALGNITGGNILSDGQLSTTANISGQYFIGNGSQLTGITVSGGTAIVNGNSNVNVAANSNVTVGVTGINNVAVFASTGEYVTGVVSATGNITGGNILTAGLVSSTGNITGGNILTAGVVSSTGNITGNYFIGNGSQLTGVTVATQIVSGTTQLAVEVPSGNIQATIGGTANVVVFTTIGANITGYVNATGNITGANATINGLVTATGNVTGSNIRTGGTISATGNLTSANINATGNVSLTGNVIAGNLTTNLQVVALGNITGGNFRTDGQAVVMNATAPPAGGVAAYLMSSTANLGVFFGSGVPTISAAQGSLYMRTDGSSTSTRMYVNTNGSTTWTAVTTAA